jgi:hypothetical protein
MSEQKKWHDLAPSQRRMIVAGGAVQLSLLASALVDIWRRPREEIRGPKRLWVGVSFVNFIGPLSYFFFGRRRPGQPAD